MKVHLPSSLSSLPKVTSTPYRIKRAERGFTVWKWFGHGNGGYKPVQHNLKTEDDGALFILRRHGLEPAEPAKPEAPAEFVMFGYDFGGLI